MWKQPSASPYAQSYPIGHPAHVYATNEAHQAAFGAHALAPPSPRPSTHSTASNAAGNHVNRRKRIDVPDFEAHTRGFGSRMLRTMGWCGGGLGKAEDGRVEPVLLKNRCYSLKGLGFDAGPIPKKKQKTLQQKQDERSPQRVEIATLYAQPAPSLVATEPQVNEPNVPEVSLNEPETECKCNALEDHLRAVLQAILLQEVKNLAQEPPTHFFPTWTQLIELPWPKKTAKQLHQEGALPCMKQHSSRIGLYFAFVKFAKGAFLSAETTNKSSRELVAFVQHALMNYHSKSVHPDLFARFACVLVIPALAREVMQWQIDLGAPSDQLHHTISMHFDCVRWTRLNLAKFLTYDTVVLWTYLVDHVVRARVVQLLAAQWRLGENDMACMQTVEHCSACFDVKLLGERVILPALQEKLGEWSPEHNAVHQLAWLSPWAHCSAIDVEDLIVAAYKKFATILKADWSPSDPSMRVALATLHRLLPGAADPLIENIVIPRLKRHLLDHFVVNPSEQDLRPLGAVLAWRDLIRDSVLIDLVDQRVFPQLLRVLHAWLNSPKVNMSEVQRWYEGWKALFTNVDLLYPEIVTHFDRALMLMDQHIQNV